MEDQSDNVSDIKLLQQIRLLDERIRRIEQQLNLSSEQIVKAENQSIPAITDSEEREEKLEFRIGQYWFAKVGILILAIGIGFLLTFPYQNLPPVLPSLFGYGITLGLVGCSYYWRNSYTLISRYFMGSSLLLFYYSTLRLHFFSDHIAVENIEIEQFLLASVILINMIIAIRRKSIYLAGINLTLGYCTALTGGGPYYSFVFISLLSVCAVFLQIRFRWNWLAIYSSALAYLSHAIWSLNNPFIGNSLQIVSSPNVHVYFILLYGLIYTVGILIRPNRNEEDAPTIISVVVNSVICYGLYFLLTLALQSSDITPAHFTASMPFLILSSVFWMREKGKYTTFFYVMTGYLALTVGIVNWFGLTASLVWLSWQSLLVIITAIWYRSKYIVVANFGIYLIILIMYMITEEAIGVMGLSFGIVALLSARIMNAKQHRLELKTEAMRSAYLASAFVFFPYALYHLLPREYVALSWVGVALIYFLLNLILKKQKYRWMAVFTLLLTVGYVLFIGIINLEPTYRILSFIVLGIVLLIVSMVYTHLRSKRSEER